MKKSLLTAIVLSLAMPVMAQTADNPLPLELGSNRLDNPGNVDEEVYYSYTAPEDQEVTVLCSSTWEFYTRAMECNADGTPGEQLPYYNGFDKNGRGSATTIFRVRGGEKYLVAISTEALTARVPFTVSATELPYDLGSTCSDPHAAWRRAGVHATRI